MEYQAVSVGTCPRCGRIFNGRPALSREDNETPICPDCGTREALASMGVPEEEQEQIVTMIHKYRKGQNGGVMNE